MRTSYRSLLSVQSPRPDWGMGLRMAVIIVGPLVAGLLADRLSDGLIGALGALNVAMADPGGADRVRARALGAATIVEALALALGTVAGIHSWVAVPAVFVVALIAALAACFGAVAGNVAFFALVMFIVGVGAAGSATVALTHLWLAALGGGWAMVVSLALWPFRPLRPAQLAAGAAFQSIGEYMGRVRGLALEGVRLQPGQTILGSGEQRLKLATAGETLAVLEGVASGARPAVRALDQLLADGESLLSRCEALAEQVAQLPARVGEALRRRVADAVSALAHRARAIEVALAHRRRDVAGAAQLERALQALDAAIAAARAHVAEGGEDIRTVVAVRGVELTLSECVADLDRAAAVAVGSDARLRAPSRETGGEPAPVTGATVGPADGPHRGWNRLRERLAREPMLLRHSSRLAVALAVGMAIAALFEIRRGYWIDITIAIILRPYIVTTFERGVQRVVGTLLGGLIAAAVLSVVSGDLAVVTVVLVLAFATFAVLPLNYGWGVTFLTPLVVLLVAFATEGGPGLAVARIVGTLIGAALAVAASLLLWPRSERPDFAPSLAHALDADRNYASLILAEGGAPIAIGADETRARAPAASAADELEALWGRLAGEPLPRRAGTAIPWEAVAGNRRLYVALVALEVQLARAYTGTLRPAAAALSAAIEALAGACRERRAPPAAASAFEQAVSDLRRDVERLAARRAEELQADPAQELRVDAEHAPTALRLRRDALLLTEFEACHNALERLESAIDAMRERGPERREADGPRGGRAPAG